MGIKMNERGEMSNWVEVRGVRISRSKAAVDPSLNRPMDNIFPEDGIEIEREILISKEAIIGRIFGKRVVMESGSQALSIVGLEKVEIGEHCHLFGPVISLGDIFIGSFSTIIGDVIGSTVKIGKNCVIKGNVIAKRGINVSNKSKVIGIVYSAAGNIDYGKDCLVFDTIAYKKIRMRERTLLLDSVVWTHAGNIKAEPLSKVAGFLDPKEINHHYKTLFELDFRNARGIQCKNVKAKDSQFGTELNTHWLTISERENERNQKLNILKNEWSKLYEIPWEFIEGKVPFIPRKEEMIQRLPGTFVRRLKSIQDLASGLLNKIQRYFFYFAPHDYKHTIRVGALINELIPERISHRMNEYEIYLLLASLACHDIGMSIDPMLWDELGIGESYNWDKANAAVRERIRDFIRNNHAMIGAKYIEKEWRRRFGDEISRHETEILAKLVESHQCSIRDPIERLREKESLTMENGSSFFVRTKFLGAILRFADSLDCSFRRAEFREFDWRNIQKGEPDQLIHWAYKMLINSAAPSYDKKKDKWKIEITHLAEDEEELRCLMAQEGCAIKDDLKSVEKVLEAGGMPYKIVTFVDARTGEEKQLTDDLCIAISKEREISGGKEKLESCAHKIIDRLEQEGWIRKKSL